MWKSKLSVAPILLMLSALTACSTYKPSMSRYPEALPIPEANPQNVAIQPSVLPLKRNQVLESTYTKLGIPYQWGGTTLKGLDCSGLTQIVYKESGIKIPRTTALQRDASTTIPVTQLQPGDLVFYKTGAKTNHVGIFVGNRKIIHASTSRKKVIVDDMDKNYWKQRFVKFGRFL